MSKIELKMNEENIPCQYQNDHFILIFSKNIEYINKIVEIQNTNCIRFMLGDETPFCIEGLKEVYYDELNIEEFIKKSYIIFYFYSHLHPNIHFIKYMKDNHKRVYYHSDIEKMNKDEIENNLNHYQESEWESYYHSLSEYRNEKQIEKQIVREYLLSNEIENHIESNSSEKIEMITYYRNMEENEIYQKLQIKCILENYKNPMIRNMVVIGKNIEEIFSTIEYERIENKRLIFINDNDDEITFQDLFIICNELFLHKIVMIIRSDVIFTTQNYQYENQLYFDFLFGDKKIYCLSRIERDIHGRYIRLQPNTNIFGGIEQDGWIFKTPITCMEEKHIDNIKEFDFYERTSELYLNYYLKEHGYELINDIRDMKMIRINLFEDLSRRDIIKPCKKRTNHYPFHILPEISALENIPFEHLFMMFQGTEDHKRQCKEYFLQLIFKNQTILFS